MFYASLCALKKELQGESNPDCSAEDLSLHVMVPMEIPPSPTKLLFVPERKLLLMPVPASLVGQKTSSTEGRVLISFTTHCGPDHCPNTVMQNWDKCKFLWIVMLHFAYCFRKCKFYGFPCK